MRLCENLAEFSPNREIDQWEGNVKEELKVLKKNSLESFGLNWKKRNEVFAQLWLNNSCMYTVAVYTFLP